MRRQVPWRCCRDGLQPCTTAAQEKPNREGHRASEDDRRCRCALLPQVPHTVRLRHGELMNPELKKLSLLVGGAVTCEANLRPLTPSI